MIDETPVVFGQQDTVVGILSYPIGEADLPPVVILGAGIIHRVGPSRISVQLARRLARSGHQVLRFDLSGIGDSPPNPGSSSLYQSVLSDIDDAIRKVASGPNERVVLIGFCSGADNAFYVASEDERVAGAVLFDPSLPRTRGFGLREAIRRILSPHAWWNMVSGRSLILRLKEKSRDHSRPPGFFGLLTTPRKDYENRAGEGLARGVKYLYVFSSGAASYCNSAKQVREVLPHVYDPEKIRVVFRPKLRHTFGRLEDQAWFEELVVEWFGRHWPPSSLSKASPTPSPRTWSGSTEPEGTGD